DVQEGQIVPAGGPLIEIASGKRIEAALGVEPDDVAYLKPGAHVALREVNRSSTQPATGQIRTISQRVDPATRLVNVLVSLPGDESWMLDTFVAGEITKSTANAMLVPRDAVLPDDEGRFALFTIESGH